MPQKLRPYSEYRDPGIPWLGEIPAHWKAERLKRVAKLNPSKGEARDVLNRNENVAFLPMEKVGSDGRIDASEQCPADSVWNGFTYFRKDDVLLAKITPCFENGKGACLDSLPTQVGFGSTEFIVLRPKTTVTAQFLYRITSLANFRQLGVDEMTGSAGQQRVPNEFVGNFVAPLPPIPEQEHIVRFLDRADELVNRLIDTKQRLIEVLTEQKQAVIHRAVLRGLDPDVPTKPTGLNWLPEVPEHWEILRAKYLFREVDVRAESGDEELLSVSHISGVTPRSQKNVTMFTAESNTEHKLCKPNDLVVNTMWAWMGALGVSRHEGLVSPSYAVYRPTSLDCLDPRYADRLLRTRQYVDEYNRRSTGIHSSRLRLYPEQFLRIDVLLPPIEEQERILRTVAEEERTIDTTIQRARREIELIREYRARLISDVVTGRLDVREEAKATKPKKANKHFHRAVLAAEIVDQYQGLSKFGWIKLQKAVILAERHLQMDEIQSEPQRAVAGPFDNPMMRSIHKQLAAQKWFKPIKGWRGYTYVPMDKRGGHRRYFETYWGGKRDEFDRLLELLKPLDTDRAEIVATLYMAWNDFLIHGEPVDDDKLVHEVLHNWDDSKRRFPEDRWRRAISWMRDNALVPQGFGTTTTVGLRNAVD